MKNQAILFFAALAFLLAACKNDAPETSASTTTTDSPIATEAQTGTSSIGTQATDAPLTGGGEIKPSLRGKGYMRASIDSVNSVIEWIGGYKPGKEERGTIKLQAGNFNVVDDELVSGRFFFDMKSIAATGLGGAQKAKLEAHLKSADFFGVEKYNTGSFKITSVTMPTIGNITHMVVGDLNLKGISKVISVPVRISIKDEKVFIESNEFTINRTDWGINFKSGILGTAKDQLIADDIRLTLKLQANMSQSK